MRALEMGQEGPGRRREEGELESLSLSSARTRSVRPVHLAAPRQSASREDAHSEASPVGADFVLVVQFAVCSGEVELACLSRPASSSPAASDLLPSRCLPADYRSSICFRCVWYVASPVFARLHGFASHARRLNRPRSPLFPTRSSFASSLPTRSAARSVGLVSSVRAPALCFCV